MIAKMFDVTMMNVSWLTDSTAGIESSANTMSVSSITTRQTATVVSARRPSMRDDELAAVVAVDDADELAQRAHARGSRRRVLVVVVAALRSSLMPWHAR